MSTVGASGPIDFNGMVRHYYLRSRPFQAEVRANFVGKKNRAQQSHGVGLRLRDELETLAKSENAKIQIVELPPGPPVLASLVAEVYGSDKSDYQDDLKSAATVADRMRREPGVAEVDDIREASVPRLVFEPDQEKAALYSAKELASQSHKGPTNRFRPEDSQVKSMVDLHTQNDQVRCNYWYSRAYDFCC